MKEAPKNKGKKPNPKKGKTAKEKVQRHLADKNDVITEQDLKEVIVGVEAVDLKEQEDRSLLAEDIPPKKVVTPWDIVDDED